MSNSKPGKHMKTLVPLVVLLGSLSISLAEPPAGAGRRLAEGLINSTWTWSTKPNDPAPKVTVSVHADGTVTWSDRPSLHSPYTVVDEYTIHQNQSTWHFSRDLKTLTVESDPAPIRWGQRK